MPKLTNDQKLLVLNHYKVEIKKASTFIKNNADSSKFQGVSIIVNNLTPLNCPCGIEIPIGPDGRPGQPRCKRC